MGSLFIIDVMVTARETVLELRGRQLQTYQLRKSRQIQVSSFSQSFKKHTVVIIRPVIVVTTVTVSISTIIISATIATFVLKEMIEFNFCGL
jgi:hypothetical protein